MDFWSLADIAAVGFLGGVIFADIGCLLGGCNIGMPSKSFFAVYMVGQLGKRWPVQGLEAFLLSLGLFKIWSEATHFHQRGKVIAKTLIYIATIKLILEPLKQMHNLDYFFNTILFILGITIIYKVTKRSILSDIKNLPSNIIKLFTDENVRKKILQQITKTWYNQKTSLIWKFRNIKKFLRRINVRFS